MPYGSEQQRFSIGNSNGIPKRNVCKIRTKLGLWMITTKELSWHGLLVTEVLEFLLLLLLLLRA